MIWWMTEGVCMEILGFEMKYELTSHHLNSKVITEGRLCTAQAVIKQVGADGVALS